MLTQKLEKSGMDVVEVNQTIKMMSPAMKESTDYCKIRNNWGSYKWPSLIELHTKLFDEGFDGAHDALADVKACAKSFFELKEREVILKS